jgi:hypothetical protein
VQNVLSHDTITNSSSRQSRQSKKATKGIIALTPEIDYDQTAMGLPPATSVVLLIAK